MVIHLMTNASIFVSDAAFQKNVHMIHSLGSLLPFIEWGFIFLPIIFHAAFGFVIMAGGTVNTSSYNNSSNFRYALQRATGVVAFLFIFLHVFHLHGWFHFESWLAVAKPAGGAQFRPYNASSSLFLAMKGFVIPALYLIGLAGCVFHLANGIWTMGITWGVWTSEKGQTRAGWVCTILGIGLMVIGSTALVGVKKVNLKEALSNESNAIDVRLETGEIDSHQVEHKAFSSDEQAEAANEAQSQADNSSGHHEKDSE